MKSNLIFHVGTALCRLSRENTDRVAAIPTSLSCLQDLKKASENLTPWSSRAWVYHFPFLVLLCPISCPTCPFASMAESEILHIKHMKPFKPQVTEAADCFPGQKRSAGV